MQTKQDRCSNNSFTACSSARHQKPSACTCNKCKHVHMFASCAQTGALALII